MFAAHDLIIYASTHTINFALILNPFSLTAICSNTHTHGTTAPLSFCTWKTVFFSALLARCTWRGSVSSFLAALFPPFFPHTSLYHFHCSSHSFSYIGPVHVVFSILIFCTAVDDIDGLEGFLLLRKLVRFLVLYPLPYVFIIILSSFLAQSLRRLIQIHSFESHINMTV